MTRGQALAEHIGHFRRRVLYESILEATAAHWEHRAGQLEAARPAHGDYHGQADTKALRAAYDRLTEAAAACRGMATLVRGTGLDAEARSEIDAILADAEVA